MSAFLYVFITFLFIMNNGRLFALIHSLSTPRKPQPPRAEKIANRPNDNFAFY